MKQAFFLITIMSIGLFSCAQTPPKAVSDAFTTKFSKAEKVEWSKENDQEWEAEFKLDGKEIAANFDLEGNWKVTEVEIGKKDISAEAHKAINLEFEGWEIEGAESIESPEFNGYEILLEKADTETEILVTVDGKISIKKVSVEEEEDEHHEECSKNKKHDEDDGDKNKDDDEDKDNDKD